MSFLARRGRLLVLVGSLCGCSIEATGSLELGAEPGGQGGGGLSGSSGSSPAGSSGTAPGGEAGAGGDAGAAGEAGAGVGGEAGGGAGQAGAGGAQGGESGQGGEGGAGSDAGAAGESGAGGDAGGGAGGGAGASGQSSGGESGASGQSGEAGAAGQGGSQGGESGTSGQGGSQGGESGTSGQGGEAGAGGGPVVVGPNGERCQEAEDGEKLLLTCPEGEVIRAVTFASYGTPLGQCGAYLGDPTCDGEGVKGKLEQQCLQQDLCMVEVSEASLGAPCVGGKRLVLEVICGKPTCGNGVLDPYEPCDEGANPDVACNKCATTCEGGFLSNDLRSCYLLTEAAKPWGEARKECQALGAGCDLVTLNTVGEHSQIATRMKQSVWVGGRRNPSAWGEMPAYAWASREPWGFGPSEQWVESKSGGGPAFPWDPSNGEPNGGDPCVELKLAQENQATCELNDEKCELLKLGLCECPVPGRPCDHDGKIDPGEECDDGNLADGDGCSASCGVECAQGGPAVEPGGALEDPATHGCYAFLKPALSWAEAGAACAALGPGYHLARVDKAEEFFLLSTFHLDLFGPNNPIWIDGTDELVEGSWGFASSATPFPFALKTIPWEPGEPNGGKGENCLALWWYGGSKNAYMVADWSCGSKSRAICEREAPGAPGP